KLLATGAGDRDDVPSTVVGIDVAFDQSALLELVENGDDVAAVDACAASELGLACGAPFLERGEEAVVVAAEPAAAVPEAVVEQSVRAVVSAADQPGRPVSDPGRGGRVVGRPLGHQHEPSSVWVLPTI